MSSMRAYMMPISAPHSDFICDLFQARYSASDKSYKAMYIVAGVWLFGHCQEDDGSSR